eukprot:CAMPEP_0119493236 /NCGR_PEP_ID=MMETSP1344-20130328/17546_1 /TAXON_ID=236787 /ORGANISM="Florenciella parvula, Strain CCMP2471" /LENGTH=30 /DNA_ID= /DNA_START= /DNA_END= /DNA_ORIENTATION=
MADLGMAAPFSHELSFAFARPDSAATTTTT